MTTSTTPEFKTYPAISTTIFDVPEPKELAGKFVYNYFLPNERESTDTFVNQESFKQHRGLFARQVELEFLSLDAVVPNSPVLSEIQMSMTEKKKLLLNNTGKILKETEFIGRDFLAVKLQDSTVTSRIFADIEASLLQKQINTNGLSPLETVFKYASETTDNIDGQSFLDSVDVHESNEYVSIDPATGKPFEVQKAGEMNSLTFNVVLSRKFAGDIATTAVKAPLSPAINIFTGALSDLTDTQVQARSNDSARRIKVSDYTRTFEPIQVEKMGLDDVFLGGNTVMGYHVRKYRTDEPDDITHIYLTNIEATNFIDTEVIYGAEYNYSITVVYLIRIFAYKGDSVVAADVLVESRESPSINISCNEVVPPEAPDGLIFYLLQNQELVLEWEYPVTPTEDIKRFQVFRRKTIDEAFSLICEIDFDDSTIQAPRKENISGYQRKVVSVPRTYYSDPDFDIDSKFIYAVCTVDAHDLSSPYSEQFLVSFDKFAGKLQIEMVSEKNAPKPYPNFLLRSQLTQDAMRDSNHTSLSCYFDPEYLKVFDGNREKVDFLQVSDDEVSYKLQLIHLNFQQSVIADINVVK